jgi:hypothetical protein
MASLPPSTVANGFRLFDIPTTDGPRGIVTITRASDGQVRKQFCPGPVVANPNLPVVVNVQPASARVGDTVTITGYKLSVTLEVDFGTTPIQSGDVISLSDTQIVCKVPLGATNGVRVRTAVGNSAYVGFTVAATVWYDFDFYARAATFLNVTNSTNYYSGAGPGWDARAVATIPLLQTDSGSGRMKYIAGQGSGASIGLTETQALVAIEQVRFRFHIEPTGTLSIYYAPPGQTGVTVSTKYVAKNGYWYAVSRTDSHFYIQESHDETGSDSAYPYTVIFDLDGMYNQGGTMYWVFHIYGDASYHLIKPQYGYV